jgi:type VI secretion system protein ImpL
VLLAPSTGSGYTFNGPWALLRLLDRARVERGASPDRALISFDIEGRKARFEVRSASAHNPLLRQDLEPFACPNKL